MEGKTSNKVCPVSYRVLYNFWVPGLYAKHCFVRQKSCYCPGIFCFPDFFDRSLRDSHFIFLLPGASLTMDFDGEVFREGVNNRSSYSVQTSGNFISTLGKLSSGVQL